MHWPTTQFDTTATGKASGGDQDGEVDGEGFEITLAA